MSTFGSTHNDFGTIAGVKGLKQLEHWVVAETGKVNSNQNPAWVRLDTSIRISAKVCDVWETEY